ncbi:MAG: hypothetical protein P1U56_17995 [Saprospiraceae bacterium]|nr:hypothetical protein [Saprospiraceae bacterium]
MKRLLIGKILITLGLIISLNPYLMVFFGGPTFLIGALIYLNTKNSIQSKLLWILTPIVIWYPLMLSFYWVCGAIGTATAQKKDYIIPENFRGKIKVVESQCGQVPKIKDGRIQFEIPSNGIYLFNGELKSGYVNEKFYIKKQNSELEEIESKPWATRDEEKDTKGSERITGIYGGAFGHFGDNKANFIEKYIETNKIYDEQVFFQITKRQDEILDSLRANCENKNGVF